MTFSLLALDQKTGTFGAAAATGSLCVGGWVIRGCLEAGMVASQGTSPSTLWRDAALDALRAGKSAETAVNSAVHADGGRPHRQLAALDHQGRGAAFTGAESVAWAGHVMEDGLVCAGNMLTGGEVLASMTAAYKGSSSAMPERLLAALVAGNARGGDSRGLLSAAMIVLSPDAPPLDLRIDHDPQPLGALSALLARVRTPPYADWLHEVPVASDPTRAPALQAQPVALGSED